MKKKTKIIIFFIIIILIIVLSLYKIFDKKIALDKTKIIEISVIDKYDQIKEIHAHPKDEEFVLVDVILDGAYYSDCGIRTKGSSIYNLLKQKKSDNFSYKLKLDYRHRNQAYNGIKEFHINSSAMQDATGIREYLVYEIYNKMGVETQEYCFGHLKLGDVERGLVTIVEVPNAEYAYKKYNTDKVNLYKPQLLYIHEYLGADLRYSGDDMSLYKSVLDQTRTEHTTDEDKKRLISIIKNINESSACEVIEENFMNFDKVIKMVAIDKTVASLDTFTRNNLRNFEISEFDGKIDIIPFDFDISLTDKATCGIYTQFIENFNLEHDDARIYSRITEIIIQNEEYLKKYYQYVEETLKILDEMNQNGTVEKICEETGNLMLSNERAVFTEQQYKDGIKDIKEIMLNRRNDFENSINVDILF